MSGFWLTLLKVWIAQVLPVQADAMNLIAGKHTVQNTLVCSVR